MPDVSAGGNLKNYRLYIMDAQGGRIRGFEEIKAASDAEAIELAEQLRGDKPMELWCRARKVRHWPALFAAPNHTNPRPR